MKKKIGILILALTVILFGSSCSLWAKSDNEKSTEPYSIGSYELQIPSDWMNEIEGVYFLVRPYAPPNLWVYYTDKFYSFSDIENRPDAFSEAVLGGMSNLEIIEELHREKYGQNEAYSITADFDESGFRVRMYANYFEDPSGGLVACLFYEESGTAGKYLQDYLDILDTMFCISKDNYETGITYEQIARMPDQYEGANIKLSGTVYDIISETDEEVDFLMMIDDDYDKLIYVGCAPDTLSYRLFEEDMITIYGVSLGLTSDDDIWDVKLPIVYAEIVDQKEL